MIKGRLDVKATTATSSMVRLEKSAQRAAPYVGAPLPARP